MRDRARLGLGERRPRGWRSWAFDIALALLATDVEVALVAGAKGTASVPAIVLTVIAGGALDRRRSRCWRRRSRRGWRSWPSATSPPA